MTSYTKDSVSDLYDVVQMKQYTQQFIRDMNARMQENRVLCVSAKNNSMKMWETYAKITKGLF